MMKAINKLIKKSNFYNQFFNNIFENIIYLSGSNFKNIKIEDIRNLKKLFIKPQFLANHVL